MRPELRARIATVVAALLGVVVAAAITIAASRLSSQSIGLAGEPITAGDELTPPRAQTRPTVPPVTLTAPPPRTTTTPPGSDDRPDHHHGSDD